MASIQAGFDCACEIFCFGNAAKNFQYVGAIRHSGPFAARCRDRAPMDGFTACPVGRIAPAYSRETGLLISACAFDPARQRISTVAAQGCAPASIRGRAPSMARSPVDMHSRSSLVRCRCTLTSDANALASQTPTQHGRVCRPGAEMVRWAAAGSKPELARTSSQNCASPAAPPTGSTRAGNPLSCSAC